MSTTQSPPALTTEYIAALNDLILRLADDELIIGHRNSEWTGLAPILEADIAFSSMAQDEMGHALAYYRLLHDLGRSDPDTLAFLRSPSDFRCASLVALDKGDWAFSIVRQYLYDTAESVRLDALGTSGYAPLAMLARKIRGEEKYHVMHGRNWVMKLGAATEESHHRMQAALDVAFPHALGLFEPTRLDATIAELGIQPREGDLCRTFVETITPFLAEAGLKLPANAKPAHGGRAGRHPPELAALLDAMQQVYRIEPTGKW